MVPNHWLAQDATPNGRQQLRVPTMTYEFSEGPSPPAAPVGVCDTERDRPVIAMTGDWGDSDTVSSYLERCQVDTPATVVAATWKHVRRLRPDGVGRVLDLGAGDGRFAQQGAYESYVGYEIDAARCAGARLPRNVRLLNRCAFSDLPSDADVCIGNPPFVRNQQIPSGWRQKVHGVLKQRTGVSLSGLANAWQYFFLNALACLNEDGLAALVVPFEWVSRPSAEALRNYIREQRWTVYVYRLREAGFARVLTTASITLVDKSCRDATWSLYEEMASGDSRRLDSPSGSKGGVLGYVPASDVSARRPFAKRGLSPGTQQIFTLSDAQRQLHQLRPGRDVVPCVTSMRLLPSELTDLDEKGFREHYVEAGRKCWLIRTDVQPSGALGEYLSAVPESQRKTKTCLKRSHWWRFTMPVVPAVLLAQGFRGRFPKAVRNRVGAHAVGGVCGIYNVRGDQVDALTAGFGGMDLRDCVVAYSSGFFKIEVDQFNALPARMPPQGDC